MNNSVWDFVVGMAQFMIVAGAIYFGLKFIGIDLSLWDGAGEARPF
jgi:hypothetical protein